MLIKVIVVQKTPFWLILKITLHQLPRNVHEEEKWLDPVFVKLRM